VGTVSRAYAIAAQRGLVTGEVGRGTYVRGVERRPGRANPVGDGGSELISLTINAPPDPLPRTLLGEALARLGADPAGLQELLAYAPKAGFAEHRAAAAQWLGRVGLPAEPEGVLLTGGAHQAITIALAGLTRPGDTLLIEALAYAGVGPIAARLGLGLRGLPLDEEGLVPEALEAAARVGGARVLFVNPTVHNPTTATMSPARREAIAALVRKHDIAVIEDDVYGLLPADRSAPIATLAPERTVYIGSASKSVAPGLRLGALLAPQRLLQPIADAQRDLFLICPPLLAELFARWLADGTADRLARAQRDEAAVRQRIAREILGSRTYQAQPTSYHLWLPLPAPWRASEFAAAVRERGVAIDASPTFAVDRLQTPHAVRVSLSAALNHERLRRALAILSATLDEPPARHAEVI